MTGSLFGFQIVRGGDGCAFGAGIRAVADNSNSLGHGKRSTSGLTQ